MNSTDFVTLNKFEINHSIKGIGVASNSTLGDTGTLVSDKKIFYIKCHWQSGNQFTLTMTDFIASWQAKVTTQFIDKVLKPQALSFEEYWKLIKSSLSSQDITREQFDYKLEPSKKSLNDINLIVLMKLSKDDNISMKSVIPLTKLPNCQSTSVDFFDYIFDKQQILQGNNKDLQERNKQLQTEFNESQSQNRLFLLDKEKIENDLYKNFVIILNQKKSKIKEYKSQLENNNNNNSKNGSCSNCRNKKILSIDEADDHANDSFDSQDSKVIDDLKTSPNLKRKTMSTTPTKNFNNFSSKNTGATFGLSLVMEDDYSSFKVPITIRKKHKANPTTTTTTTSSNSNNNVNNNSKTINTNTMKSNSFTKSPIKAPQPIFKAPNLVSKTTRSNSKSPTLKSQAITPIKTVKRSIFKDDDEDMDAFDLLKDL
ncbi:hypothetical protein DLAC_07802 [Tieghemostelium lacteum]|uniref:Uncharacterized protein n=1 Tax=Tieghemostelium lacteum TaxID=361077 RepID=A0A151ZAE9_TIELA|nr:hypothetical protein DLAC_07802 [Tieghemostelium lacteum]|eukprot:KYQ90927.1 hypothetical protein DLAC_07802 [Tieghemostelium lacteum]